MQCYDETQAGKGKDALGLGVGAALSGRRLRACALVGPAAVLWLLFVPCVLLLLAMLVVSARAVVV